MLIFDIKQSSKIAVPYPSGMW
ncbi:unnamed protein product [Acanthoscelides obtectus]|uniref:Uncharacterized protein n=1 Tax=Acanthoscelides obtectus TaxID=200917 RepID=A0A9P0LLM0_ACAOB|nr:unnamed protein product [Acanthoscelides obtectus]CAK1626059.1 hypothetical protein AOBTE_LOCUS3572 [Acanthoscelides obtectus]